MQPRITQHTKTLGPLTLKTAAHPAIHASYVASGSQKFHAATTNTKPRSTQTLLPWQALATWHHARVVLNGLASDQECQQAAGSRQNGLATDQACMRTRPRMAAGCDKMEMDLPTHKTLQGFFASATHALCLTL
jgi:hypothetical protein